MRKAKYLKGPYKGVEYRYPVITEKNFDKIMDKYGDMLDFLWKVGNLNSELERKKRKR